VVPGRNQCPDCCERCLIKGYGTTRSEKLIRKPGVGPGCSMKNPAGQDYDRGLFGGCLSKERSCLTKGPHAFKSESETTFQVGKLFWRCVAHEKPRSVHGLERLREARESRTLGGVFLGLGLTLGDFQQQPSYCRQRKDNP